MKADTESSTEIGTFAGFKLLVTSKGDMLLRGVGQYRGTVNMDDASGTISRLQNVADRVETMMKATETRIAENKSAIKKLEKTAASSFAKVVWEAGDRPETERLPACDTQMVVWPEAPALSVAK